MLISLWVLWNELLRLLQQHTAGIVIATTPEPNKDYEKGKEIFLQVWGEEPTTEGSVLGDLMPNLFG